LPIAAKSVLVPNQKTHYTGGVVATKGFGMSDDDIDLDRVLIDPDYRRRVIEYLNAAASRSAQSAVHPPLRDAQALSRP
jgi:hypothetical protein